MQNLRSCRRQRTLNLPLHSRCSFFIATHATPNPWSLSRSRLFLTNSTTPPKQERIPNDGTNLHEPVAILGGKTKMDEGKRNERVRWNRGRQLFAILGMLGVPIYGAYNHFYPPPVGNIFNPPRFTPFSIIDREEASPTSIILTVQPKSFTSKGTSDSDPYQASWERGTWSVEVKQPQLQIARSYTPLPPREGDKNGELRFLIRREPKGEVSGYLHALDIGGTVELRGPKPELDLSENIRELVFLAGGTGIAPALQVVHTLLERKNAKEDAPRIWITWTNRRREDCIGGPSVGELDTKSGHIVRELRNLQQRYPDHLVVEYMVDEEGSFLDQKKISQLTKSGSEVKFGPVHTRIDSKLLIISGPEGFINYVAGPKRWEGGKEGQGELGGVLAKMHMRNWKVWKL